MRLSPVDLARRTPDIGGSSFGGPGAGNSLPPPESKSKIQFNAGTQTTENIESRWKRAARTSGQGATHVRTFTGKLNPAGLEYLDKHINEWLDNHPDADVKFSTMSVGELATSLGREPTIIVQVWI